MALMDLLGQLARGRHDQRAHLAGLARASAAAGSAAKGGRLAGAGLRQPDDVAALPDKPAWPEPGSGWALCIRPRNAGRNLRMKISCKAH